MKTKNLDEDMTRILNQILLHFREYYRLQAMADRAKENLPPPLEITETKPDKPSPLSPHAMKLREVLHAWRNEYARERGIATFMVFPNRTLDELARLAPTTPAALEGVYGMGPRRREELGMKVVAAIRSATGKKGSAGARSRSKLTDLSGRES